MGNQPSVIPPGGRVLELSEHAALLEEMARIVATSHLFKSLDDAGRARVLESGWVATFAAGDELIRQGEPGDTMYLVLEGTVRVQTQSGTGTVQLADLGRGACVGEVSVLTGGPRTATVTALTDVSAVAFQRHRIERVLVDYPKVRQLLETLVEGRARDTVEKIVGS